jgi:hypothetical protein
VLATALNWASAAATPAPTAVDLNPDAGWTTPSDFVDPGAILPQPVPLRIAYRGELLAVAGKLTGISMFDGFVTGRADFTIETSAVGVDLPGTAPDPTAPTLLRLGLSNAELKIGDPAGINIAFSGASLALASLKAGTPAAGGDTRQWLALKGTIGVATINGLPTDLALTIRSLTVEINRASGFHTSAASVQTPAVALNWLTQLNLDRDAAAGEATDDRLVIAGVPIDFTGDFLRASGRVDVSLFNFVQGSVAFAFQQQTVDVNTGSGPVLSAKLTTLALNILGDDGNPANGAETGLWIGTPDRSIGFSVASGSLAIATVKPTTTTDARSWTAITAQIANGSFTGGGPLEATVNSLRVEVNKAAGTGATALNWLTAIDTDGDHANFNAKTVSISVETGGTPIVHEVRYTGERLRAAGSLTIDILGFVSGTVGFSYETKTVDAHIGSGDDLDNATLSLILADGHQPVRRRPGRPRVLDQLGRALAGAAQAERDRERRSLVDGADGHARQRVVDRHRRSHAVAHERDGEDQPGRRRQDHGRRRRGRDQLGHRHRHDPAGAFAGADPVAVVDESNVSTPITLSGNLLELSGTATFDVFGFVSGAAT